MPPIQITLLRGNNLVDVPIAVEVVDSNLDTQWKQAIALGQVKETSNLPAGHYSIVVHLPSGRTMTKACNLKENDTLGRVEMSITSGSPHESLEWALISKPGILVTAQERKSQLLSVWLRLWGRDA